MSITMVHTPTYTRIVTPGEILYVEAHYRETHTGLTAQQAWVRGIVVFATGTRRQLAHAHHVTDLTKHGDGICHSCGLRMWSPAWVAAEVFGEGTAEHIATRIRAYVEMVNGDRLAFDLPRILASMTDEDPATLTIDRITVPSTQEA